MKGLWRSRETKAKKCRNLKQQLDEAKRLVARQAAKLQRQQEEIRELKQQVQRLDDEKRRPAPTQNALPDDPPLKRRQFGRRLMCLAVNLARVVGLRATERVLKLFWEWLGVDEEIPHGTTIRSRLLARLNMAFPANTDAMQLESGYTWRKPLLV